ncbi:MAG: hypothetical protein IJZ29_02360 [Clostridia bacterium]|nr:hypothetical protein [Clostridia bacterium]
MYMLDIVKFLKQVQKKVREIISPDSVVEIREGTFNDCIDLRKVKSKNILKRIAEK